MAPSLVRAESNARPGPWTSTKDESYTETTTALAMEVLMSRWCSMTAATARATATVREAMYYRKLVQWIREEFEAAPDLRLTTREAAAFLGLDLDTSERVLSQLLNVGALTQDPDGRFVAVSGNLSLSA